MKLSSIVVSAGLIATLYTGVFACTPTQSQAVAKGVSDAAACIEAHALPGADPKAVAIACGLDAVPDLIGIIVSVIMSKTADAHKLGNCTVIMVDAGAPDGVGK